MPTAPKPSSRCASKREANRGAWTPEEDQKLARVIEVHGPRRWKIVAIKAGLNRCGKSCRLRWLNYLRPNIKRGNISDQEEDLILRLHKLLGNRWSLIAGRLPGRTDNEIKNYWNSHLSKKIKHKDQNHRDASSSPKDCSHCPNTATTTINGSVMRSDTNVLANPSFNPDGRIFDFSIEDPTNLEWMSRFMEMDEGWFDFAWKV